MVTYTNSLSCTPVKVANQNTAGLEVRQDHVIQPYNHYGATQVHLDNNEMTPCSTPLVAMVISM